VVQDQEVDQDVQEVDQDVQEVDQGVQEAGLLALEVAVANQEAAVDHPAVQEVAHQGVDQEAVQIAVVVAQEASPAAVHLKNDQGVTHRANLVPHLHPRKRREEFLVILKMKMELQNLRRQDHKSSIQTMKANLNLKSLYPRKELKVNN
jgi:hypothetical protein